MKTVMLIIDSGFDTQNDSCAVLRQIYIVFNHTTTQPFKRFHMCTKALLAYGRNPIHAA